MTRWICTKFFSGFRRKHLFITICIEKHCTWLLNEIYVDELLITPLLLQ